MAVSHKADNWLLELLDSASYHHHGGWTEQFFSTQTLPFLMCNNASYFSTQSVHAFLLIFDDLVGRDIV
jgi:hypothetical protein